jgi:hypothetical protein
MIGLMECYTHAGAVAVGACKSCGKGLCRACAVDVGNGLACPGACEQEVRALNQIVQRNKTAHHKAGHAYAQIALFYIVAGTLFLTGGLLDWRGLRWMLVPAGLLLLVAAAIHFTTGRRFADEG